ncbi:hypothetical protein [Amycolatopsis saalfeldensis]|uniref:hypothetical protein n=1 Tax=Amycolatopsis saalfeldensis TaxID=394193 RepID=UPI000B1B0750|nr:hypothetical protein [Amycolatopsis saalfeldensis]
MSGIELSRAMAARLAGKPGGGAVEVTIGDMTTTRVAGRFSMGYLVFNTISNARTGRCPVPAAGGAGPCRPAPATSGSTSTTSSRRSSLRTTSLCRRTGRGGWAFTAESTKHVSVWQKFPSV